MEKESSAIKELRKRTKFSKKAFDILTGKGLASLARKILENDIPRNDGKHHVEIKDRTADDNGFYDVFINGEYSNSYLSKNV